MYQIRNKISWYNLFLVLVISLIFFFTAFSPLIGFLFCISLLVCGFANNIIIRIPIVLCTIFNISYIGASKKFMGYDVDDDFGNIYLPAFNYISEGGSIFYKEFSGGVEFLFPLIMKLFSIFFGSISPVTLLALYSFLILFIFYIWLEKYGSIGLSDENKALLIALFLTFISSSIYLHIMRQSLGSVILLFSLSSFINKKYFTSIIFLLIASVAHLSSLFIFILYLILLIGNDKYKKIILLISVIFLIIFPFIITSIVGSGILGAGTYKAEYYYNILSEIELSKLGISSIMLSIGILGLFFFKDNEKNIKDLLYYLLIINLILSPLDQLPLRIMNLAFLLTGFFLFFSTYKIKDGKKIIFSLLIIAKCILMVNYYDAYSLQGLQMPSYQTLWYSYPWADDEPFYYLKK